MKKNIGLFFIVVICCQLYGMDNIGITEIPSQKPDVERWTIRNLLMGRKKLYVRVRGENTLVATPGIIKRNQSSKYVDSQIQEDGTVELDSIDYVEYKVATIQFPIRGRIWTDDSKNGITFTIKDRTELLNLSEKKKYPFWGVTESIDPVHQ